MPAARGLDIGPGLLECHLEIAIVDAGEHLAGLDRLVVAHQHVGDVARDLRARSSVLSAWT